mmetsp:Transcript_33190/g.86793  ORF Transcript_33190/g.86793 Transcript_33190/m.86793 type:complete len:200 (+) Transcript_33190:1835-2434(+)
MGPNPSLRGARRRLRRFRGAARGDGVHDDEGCVPLGHRSAGAAPPRRHAPTNTQQQHPDGDACHRRGREPDGGCRVAAVAGPARCCLGWPRPIRQRRTRRRGGGGGKTAAARRDLGVSHRQRGCGKCTAIWQLGRNRLARNARDGACERCHRGAHRVGEADVDDDRARVQRDRLHSGGLQAKRRCQHGHRGFFELQPAH